MYSGDELYTDHDFDPFEQADLRLDQLRDTSACPSCGSREQVRLGPDMAGVYGCSNCRTYDRCERHNRWTMAEHGGRCPQCEAWRDDEMFAARQSEDEPLDTNREGQPEFNGAFR